MPVRLRPIGPVERGSVGAILLLCVFEMGVEDGRLGEEMKTTTMMMIMMTYLRRWKSRGYITNTNFQVVVLSLFPLIEYDGASGFTGVGDQL